MYGRTYITVRTYEFDNTIILLVIYKIKKKKTDTLRTYVRTY